MSGLEAADRGGATARQDGAAGVAADALGDPLAASYLWRHRNGARWRGIPAELGAWWRAAQLFIRWAKQGVWERLLDLLQQHDLALGMSFLEGTTIRAHHKAAGAQKRGATATSERCARRLAARAAAMGQKPA